MGVPAKLAPGMGAQPPLALAVSVKYMTAVWALQLEPTSKLVLLSLADQANDDGECYPSTAAISERACIEWRQVFRILSALEQAGHISRFQRKGRSTLYRITPVTHDTPVIGDTPVAHDSTPLSPMTGTPVTHDTPREEKTLLLNRHLTEDSRRAASGGSKTSPVPQSAETGAPDESTLDKALFAEARRIFGNSCGGMVNRAIREKGKPWVVQLIESCRRMDAEQARAYFAAALKPKTRTDAAGRTKVAI